MTKEGRIQSYSTEVSNKSLNHETVIVATTDCERESFLLTHSDLPSIKK